MLREFTVGFCWSVMGIGLAAAAAGSVPGFVAAMVAGLLVLAIW